MPWTPHHCHLVGVFPPSMPGRLSFSVRPWLTLRPAEGDAPKRERLISRCRARYIGAIWLFFFLFFFCRFVPHGGWNASMEGPGSEWRAMSEVSVTWGPSVRSSSLEDARTSVRDIWRRVGRNSLVPGGLAESSKIEPTKLGDMAGKGTRTHVADGLDVSERHTQVHTEQEKEEKHCRYTVQREMMRSTPPISWPLLSIYPCSTTRPLARRCR